MIGGLQDKLPLAAALKLVRAFLMHGERKAARLVAEGEDQPISAALPPTRDRECRLL